MAAAGGAGPDTLRYAQIRSDTLRVPTLHAAWPAVCAERSRRVKLRGNECGRKREREREAGSLLRVFQVDHISTNVDATLNLELQKEMRQAVQLSVQVRPSQRQRSLRFAPQSMRSAPSSMRCIPRSTRCALAACAVHSQRSFIQGGGGWEGRRAGSPEGKHWPCAQPRLSAHRLAPHNRAPFYPSARLGAHPPARPPVPRRNRHNKGACECVKAPLAAPPAVPPPALLCRTLCIRRRSQAVAARPYASAAARPTLTLST